MCIILVWDGDVLLLNVRYFKAVVYLCMLYDTIRYDIYFKLNVHRQLYNINNFVN